MQVLQMQQQQLAAIQQQISGGSMVGPWWANGGSSVTQGGSIAGQSWVNGGSIISSQKQQISPCRSVELHVPSPSSLSRVCTFNFHRNGPTLFIRYLFFVNFVFAHRCALHLK
jgi:hypothetical protein